MATPRCVRASLEEGVIRIRVGNVYYSFGFDRNMELVLRGPSSLGRAVNEGEGWRRVAWAQAQAIRTRLLAKQDAERLRESDAPTEEP